MKLVSERFRSIDTILHNIYLFNTDNIQSYKNQLFSKKSIPFEIVNEILNLLTNKNINSNIYFEFTLKTMINKKIIDKIKSYIPLLKTYYLKCKHTKYLENLNEKRIITLFRQILKPYYYTITSHEKYSNKKKYLLYIIENSQNKKNIKKINSFINFD
jgi:hypothetical protein